MQQKYLSQYITMSNIQSFLRMILQKKILKRSMLKRKMQARVKEILWDQAECLLQLVHLQLLLDKKWTDKNYKKFTRNKKIKS